MTQQMTAASSLWKILCCPRCMQNSIRRL